MKTEDEVKCSQNIWRCRARALARPRLFVSTNHSFNTWAWHSTRLHTLCTQNPWSCFFRGRQWRRAQCYPTTDRSSSRLTSDVINIAERPIGFDLDRCINSTISWRSEVHETIHSIDAKYVSESKIQMDEIISRSPIQ